MSRFLRSIATIVLVVFVFVFSAEAQAKEAGLVTYVKGNVFYGKSKEDKAASFMKAKIDDVFYLDEGAAMHIVYFKNGRKEKWTGSAEVTITEEMGTSPSDIKPSVTESKSSSSANNLREIPAFIQNLNTERTGGSKVRALNQKSYNKYEELGDEEKVKVNEAKAVYMEMLKTSEPDDITPELFSIGILSQFKLYKETLGLVNTALKKQPEHDGLLLVKESLEIILSRDAN